MDLWLGSGLKAANAGPWPQTPGKICLGLARPEASKKGFLSPGKVLKCVSPFSIPREGVVCVEACLGYFFSTLFFSIFPAAIVERLNSSLMPCGVYSGYLLVAVLQLVVTLSFFENYAPVQAGAPKAESVGYENCNKSTEIWS